LDEKQRIFAKSHDIFSVLGPNEAQSSFLFCWPKAAPAKGLSSMIRAERQLQSEIRPHPPVDREIVAETTRWPLAWFGLRAA
jgi:hypothetical protein